VAPNDPTRWPSIPVTDWQDTRDTMHLYTQVTGRVRPANEPRIRSYEPGEDWWWCYPDELFFEVDGAPPAPSHPRPKRGST